MMCGPRAAARAVATRRAGNAVISGQFDGILVLASDKLT